MQRKADLIEVLLIILLTLLGLFIGYQISDILLGGSWAPENVIIALLIFTLGLSVTILRKSDENSHKLKNIEKSFVCLANDFKSHMKEYHYTKNNKIKP